MCCFTKKGWMFLKNTSKFISRSLYGTINATRCLDLHDFGADSPPFFNSGILVAKKLFKSSMVRFSLIILIRFPLIIFFRLTNLIKKLSFFAIYLCVIGLRTFCFIRNRWIFLKACINIWQFYRLLFSCWSRFCFTFEGGLKIVNKNLFIRIR